MESSEWPHKRRLRLLFDECCSSRLPRELSDFYRVDYPDLEVRHLLQDYKPGTIDPDWLKPLKDDRTWIVITKDSGRKSAQDKLPLICKEWGITHIALTANLIHAGFTTYKNALVAVWPQLFLLHRLPPGTCVKLGMGRLRGDIPCFELRIKGKSLTSVLEAQPCDQPNS